MKLKQIAALCALASTAAFTQAAPIWQDFSITGLYGENYEQVFTVEPEEEQATLTLEYAAGLKYGDVFFFMDRLRGGDDVKSTYFELSPRLSLSEVTGQKLAFGPVKDVLISTTWEGSDNDLSFGPVKDVLVSTTWEGGEGFDNFLYGIGFALDIPYTSYANINFYRANNENTKDDYQMTITYAVPFKIGSEEFLADAFLDWSTGEDSNHKSELNWTSQYKWNVGKHISPDTKLYVGVEHSVWENKYGSNKSQNDVSALVKYHF